MKACDCDDPNLVIVTDRNMAPVYSPGNPYSRLCTNCSRRYFCSKEHWTGADERYVIPKGEEEPVHEDDFDDENLFECPNCGHPNFGQPSECEACGEEYVWE